MTSTTTLIHRWVIDDENREVRLFRDGNRLDCHWIDVATGEKRDISLPPFPDGDSIDTGIAKLVAMQPFLDDGVRFEHVFRSKIDPAVVLDGRNWAITLADTLSPDPCAPTTYGGHAKLYFEGIEGGSPCLYETDYDGSLRFKSIQEEFDPKRLLKKTETWLVPQCNFDHIKERILYEVQAEKQGNSLVMFEYLGGDTIETSSDRIARTRNNCFTWARQKLAFAGINLYRSPYPKSITLPNALISPRSLYSKEQVQILVCHKQTGEQIATIDVTGDIHKELMEPSWKVHRFFLTKKTEDASWPPYIKYAAKAEFAHGHIDPVRIPIQVQGYGLYMVDVTRAIERWVKVRIEAGDRIIEEARKSDELQELRDLESALESALHWEETMRRDMAHVQAHIMELEMQESSRNEQIQHLQRTLEQLATDSAVDLMHRKKLESDIEMLTKQNTEKSEEVAFRLQREKDQLKEMAIHFEIGLAHWEERASYIGKLNQRIAQKKMAEGYREMFRVKEPTCTIS